MKVAIHLATIKLCAEIGLTEIEEPARTKYVGQKYVGKGFLVGLLAAMGFPGSNSLCAGPLPRIDYYCARAMHLLLIVVANHLSEYQNHGYNWPSI